MKSGLLALYVTAASIGFIHTLLGPDHYLPFIVMSKARKWSLAKTGFLTFVCGIGHIMSSVVIGVIGIIFGVAVMRLETLEAGRGNLAGWALLAFGFAYFVWGLHQAIKNKPHKHIHSHINFEGHSHGHSHASEHAHVHEDEKKNITPWILFTIFVLGPCEPLIPILMYPAAKNSIVGLIGVTAIFGTVTILTMLTIVMVSSFGINFLPMGKLERYSHALAGAAILLCGIAINFLGL
ncbi:MAG: sulfite exporter TauE/SafE family protein [Candidatus Omnitrophica bacterium]|nr:sulfite exporter TauE/SafE family protein [Candidatus Omnitrophota bacterium]